MTRSALLTSGMIEAIGLGAALAVLLVGRPLLARLASTPARTTCAWLSTARASGCGSTGKNRYRDGQVKPPNVGLVGVARWPKPYPAGVTR